jgi:hypothetical protein
MKSATTWIALSAAAASVAAVVAVAVGLWGDLGGMSISLGGWLAMVFGVLVTLALGIGLMTLVFISSRRGYDDPARKDR